MENLLTPEQIAERHALQVLNPEYSIENLLQAFEVYRRTCETCIFTNIQLAEQYEARLWHAHTEARKYLHKHLSLFRKQGDIKAVATRQMIKGFLKFIKDSQSFYRAYILKLSLTFGIPELEAVAQKVKHDGTSESPAPSTSHELRNVVLAACHRALIYLGDLSRYRASERLDKNPDFGPAVGYYALACTLCPQSGMGHHQQAHVALEQRDHLRAIYHLYRAITVAEPHPNAAKNLRIEFEKTNAAWDRGDLIQKGQPNDPEAPKRALTGWFVRLHSMCFKGESFRGYDELEQELLSQFSAQLKGGSLGNSLFRMVVIDIAAQFHAGDNFQKTTSNEDQQALLFFFRLNMRFFTLLLSVFADSLDLTGLVIGGDADGEPALAAKLTTTSRQLLPGLRLYSSWLLCNSHLVIGLCSDDFVRGACNELWSAYGRAIDLVAAVFPIWDLDDSPEVSYMLEEDVDTLGFSALQHPRTAKIWHDKDTGALRRRFNDAGVVRLTEDEEMLARIKDFVSEGVFLANDTQGSPLSLLQSFAGVRIAFEGKTFDLPAELKIVETPPPNMPAKANTTISNKPLSYAAAAAASVPSTPPVARVSHNAASESQISPKTASVGGPASNQTRQAQLIRMVDDLLEDEDCDNPVTPPQLRGSSPAVINNGEGFYHMMRDSAHDMQVPNYNMSAKPVKSRMSVPSAARTPQISTASASMAVRDSPVSSLWEHSPLNGTGPSSQFPSGLPTGTIGSPVSHHPRGHSRVNSTGSTHSRISPLLGEPWPTFDVAARADQHSTIPGLGAGSESYRRFREPGVASPLLFGAGGGLWSTTPLPSYQQSSSPTGRQPG